MVELTAEQLHALRITVAEVLGWHHIGGPSSTGHSWGTPAGVDGPSTAVPDYPNDPAQIGPMLNHFQAIWNDYKDPSEYRNWNIGSKKDLWLVTIRDWNGNRVGFGDASTLELAICLAIAEYVGKGKRD